eukprot:14984356-Alexandrium_andersonii.AAC.1
MSARRECCFGVLRLPGVILVVAIGLIAHNGAELTPPELSGPILRLCLGARRSNSECLMPFCTF